MTTTREVIRQEDREGFVLVTEQVTTENEWGQKEVREVEAAYTNSGHLIGEEWAAKYLIEDRGIKPELANEGDNICSVGYCKGEDIWYAWTHPRHPRKFMSETSARKAVRKM